MFAVSTLSISTHLSSVLKNRKNGTPETLDNPLKLEHFENFSKFLLKLELTSLWISSGKNRILGIILLHEKEVFLKRN